jgi:hypothetical protein
VRIEVAHRLEPEQLGALARDPDIRVRHVVAERIDAEHLAMMQDDTEELVREVVRSRGPVASVIPLKQPE